MELYSDIEKLYTTKENLKTTLEKYGVAIIPRVLSEKECEKMVNGIWDFLEHITSTLPPEGRLSRDDESTWRNFYNLFPMHSMLLQHWGVGHAQVSWNMRQKKKIARIFAALWQVKPEELLVSFDGLSFAFPPETTNRGYFRGDNALWLHTDQSYLRNGFECVQSWVTGLDVNKGDATLMVLEGSHKYHAEFAKEYRKGIFTKAPKPKDFIKTMKGDWYKLEQNELAWYINKGCAKTRISAPKGSMVFWDSRTIHCGVEALKGREIPNFRAVIYLCYMPRNLVTPAMLKKKKQAFEGRRTTNHWPCKPKLFNKAPRTYGKPIPKLEEIPEPKLTLLGWKLAGFEDADIEQ